VACPGLSGVEVSTVAIQNEEATLCTTENLRGTLVRPLRQQQLIVVIVFLVFVLQFHLVQKSQQEGK
jgi:hypothetical protein